ncbi:MAG: xanthine dehydrogenase family protein molybdopterin-binding subunit [Velocimicrobium sp.]
MQKNNCSIIGKSCERVDAYDKVTGKAKYADDIVLPGMLVAGCVHTTHPHANVTIDTTKALKIPGVVCILTSKDFKKPQSMMDFYYCTDTPKFIGDVVAIVAAESKEILAKAIREVQIDYEDLPAVYTIEEALREDAAIIREKGVGLQKEIPQKSTRGNVFFESYKPLRKGDITSGFLKSDVILERTYTTQFVEHAYIEPESVLAYYDLANGTITVRSCSQQGHAPRDFVADALQIPMNRVKSLQCTVGGSFGGKFEIVGIMCARAARVLEKTNRPCKMTFSREDSVLESAKRHPFQTTIKIGASKDGKIIAYKAKQIENCGAYNNQAPWMNIRAMVHSAGPYNIEDIHTDTYGVYTNNPTPCAFRGYSSPQVIFGNEMIIDELAEALHMTVAEIKRKNLLRQGDYTATGQKLIHETLLATMMEDIIQDTEYENKERLYKKQTGVWKKGVGLVTSYRGSALGGEGVDASGAMFTALQDGSFLLHAALMEIGQGLHTVYLQIASEASGIKMDDIMVEAVDSNAIPDSGLTVASRSTAQGGQSVRLAGEKMKEMLMESGRILLNTSADETVNIKDSICYIEGKEEEKKISVSEICLYRKYEGLPMATYQWYMPRPLINDETTGQGEAFTTYAYGVSVAEVEVHVHTGQVRVEKITAYHDVGRAINPSLIKGQIYGGILMGMGFGLWEEVRMQKGKTQDTNFDSYHIATSMDMPKMDIKLYECDDLEGTYGAKCIAEAATEMIGTALALAVKHAIGKPIRSLPVSMKKIRNELDE